jgi:hypothetical protein
LTPGQQTRNREWHVLNRVGELKHKTRTLGKNRSDWQGSSLTFVEGRLCEMLRGESNDEERWLVRLSPNQNWWSLSGIEREIDELQPESQQVVRAQ